MDTDRETPIPARGRPSPQAAPTRPRTLTPAPLHGLALVGRTDDPEEHAADARSERALARLRPFGSGAGTAATPQRPPAGAETLDTPVRRSPVATAAQRVGAAVGRDGGRLDTATTARLDAIRGRGTALPPGVRRRMEHAFDVDLGDVQVHTGAEAAHLSSAIAAQAFTSGRDIVFGAGQWTPGSPEGERLLAHEIAHVVDGRVDEAQPVRRKPVKLDAPDGDADHTDSTYPALRLRHVKSGIYEVRNRGPFEGALVVWMEDSTYSFKDPAGDYSDWTRDPLDITAAIGGAPVGPAVLTDYPNIGASGQGAAHVTTPTRLRTTGLNSCVAWLLHNAEAAYLAHIVVTSPSTVRTAGLADQVEALAAQFMQVTGAPPTHVRLHVDADQPGYPADHMPAWLDALVPQGCAGSTTRGPGVLEHTVQPGAATTNERWVGAPITVDEG